MTEAEWPVPMLAKTVLAVEADAGVRLSAVDRSVDQSVRSAGSSSQRRLVHRTERPDLVRRQPHTDCKEHMDCRRQLAAGHTDLPPVAGLAPDRLAIGPDLVRKAMELDLAAVD